MTTNRDKINAMTNEELAKLFLSPCDFICNREYCLTDEHNTCNIAIVEWLESTISE